MKTKPIYKCTCTNCNYTAQVVRERYFEKSCKQDIDNRKCTHCNRLFLAAVTEKAIRIELPDNEESARMFAEDKDKFISLVSSYMNWENPIPGAELEKIRCLWCGSPGCRAIASRGKSSLSLQYTTKLSPPYHAIQLRGSRDSLETKANEGYAIWRKSAIETKKRIENGNKITWKNRL